MKFRPTLFVVTALLPFCSVAQQPKDHVIDGFSQKGLGVFMMNGEYGIVKDNGTILLNKCDSVESFYAEIDYNNHYSQTFEAHNVIFRKNGKYGVFNDSTGVILKAKFEEAGWYLRDQVLWLKISDHILFVDVTRKKLKPGRPIDVLNNRNAAFSMNDYPKLFNSLTRTFITDTTGKIIHTCDYVFDEELAFGGFFTFHYHSGTGVFDVSSATEVVPPLFGNAGFHLRFDDNINPVIYVETKSGMAGAYNLSGKMIIDTSYTELNDFNPYLHLATGVRDHDYYLIDENGKEMLKSNNDIYLIRDSHLMIYQNGNYDQLFDLDTRTDLTEPYHSIQPIADGLIMIQNDTAFGIIDHKGNVILKPVYDQIIGPNNGCFIVYRGDSTGLMNENGKVIEPLAALPWEMRPQQFDTLYFPNDVWIGSDHYSINLGLDEDDGPSGAPPVCPIGKCYEANKNAARNYMLCYFPITDGSLEMNYPLYDFFEAATINDYAEYNDDEIRDIEHTLSFQCASRFSFTVEQFTTADEGSSEDDVEYFNYYFPVDHWEELDLTGIFNFKNYPYALLDSIKARSEFRENDPDDHVDLQFSNDLDFGDVLFYLNDDGITFIVLNSADESLSQHIQYRMAYSEFTWKELTPYLRKDFIALLKRK